MCVCVSGGSVCNMHTQELTSVMGEEFTTVEGKRGRAWKPSSFSAAPQSEAWIMSIRHSSRVGRTEGLYRDSFCFGQCSVSLPGSSLTWSHLWLVATIWSRHFEPKQQAVCWDSQNYKAKFSGFQLKGAGDNLGRQRLRVTVVMASRSLRSSGKVWLG